MENPAIWNMAANGSMIFRPKSSSDFFLASMAIVRRSSISLSKIFASMKAGMSLRLTGRLIVSFPFAEGARPRSPRSEVLKKPRREKAVWDMTGEV